MEVVTLCSLLGLRTIATRQSGTRSDPAHRIGLSCADVVWVPQHRDLEPISDGVDERWIFTGAFSRNDDLTTVPTATAPRLVLLVVGGGGSTFDDAGWRDASAPPGWRIVIAGTPHRWSNGGVCSVGHVEPLAGLLGAASVVISAAGWSSVADAVAARTRLVLVPERRPFDEQVARARRLHELGLAIALATWPHPRCLAALVEQAERLTPSRWEPFYDRCGAPRTAAMIDELHQQ
jgi:predicted glycosyltransferase